MLKNIYNMGIADQVARTCVGILLAYLGFLKPDVINNNLLNTVVGVFGLLNIVSATARTCPVYLLINFSTRKDQSAERSVSVESNILDKSRQRLAATRLRIKLLLSVVIPMLILLIIFGSMLFDMNYNYKLSTISKNPDVASDVASNHLQIVKATSIGASEQALEATKTTIRMVEEGIKDVDLFYYHDSSGTPIESPFDKGLEQSALLTAIIELHQSGINAKDNQARGTLRIDQKIYIWSVMNAGPSDRWFTSIIPSPTGYTVYGQLFSPELIVIFIAMVLMSTWASAYIIRKFLSSIESSAQQLQHRTLHDPLTGLPNRLSIEGVISKRMASLNENTECIALLMLDIIDFRDINDTLGYALGDKLLVEIGNNLSEIDPDNIDVVIMGGDVFCLVCKTDLNRLSVSRLSNEVHDSLEQLHYLDDVPVAVQIRVGVSFYPTDSTQVGELIRCSDIALAEAKTLRLKDCYFQREQDTHSIRKLTLLARLRTAIEQEELTLVYQPKIDIQNNQLVGVEVLVRWTDEQYGAVSPVEFVTWAEKSGLIDKLTRWVLTAAERQCREWRDRGYVVPFSVNLSPTNLYDSELIPLVAKLIDKGSFGNGMLELEITENAVMEDPEKALQTMKMLNNMGVSFAIDDFGTGLSSFTYLRKFPVNNLKIDRAFIQDVDENDKDAILLQSMINLGHGLGCVVTAEGVEEQESFDRLKEFGCDHVQGFLVCKPLTADKLIRWLDTSDWLSIRSAA